MFYIKSPAPFFRHPPRGITGIAFRSCTDRFLRGERGCGYIALYHEEETPPLFPLPLLSIGRRSPHHQPPPAPDHQPQPRRWIKPQPEQSTGIALTGRETAQKRHSISRCPAAPTEIFNSPLNLTGKANRPRRIAPHQPPPSTSPPPAPPHLRSTLQYLRIPCKYSVLLMFPRVSSLSRVFYSPRLPLSLLSQ